MRKIIRLAVVLLLLFIGYQLVVGFYHKGTNSQDVVLPPPIDSQQSQSATTVLNEDAVKNLFSDISKPQVQAKSWIVFDADSHQVLSSFNEHIQVEPASITKLMTAYLVFEALEEKHLSLNQIVVTNEFAWKRPGSRTFLEVNKPVDVNTLLQGMIVQSGNDATVMLAYATSGTLEAFVDLMNKKAKELGMINTHFVNPDGLPAQGHLTTADDLRKLVQNLIMRFPQYMHYFSLLEFEHNHIKQPNRNGLLRRGIGVDGFKTGHTNSAGYCLVSTALRDGRRIVAIVLGADSIKIRERASEDLLNWAFQNTAQKTLVQQDMPLMNAHVWEGQSNEVAVKSAQNILITVPRTVVDQLQTITSIDKNIVAPIHEGQVLGHLDVLLGGKVLYRYPLLAAKSIEQASFFGRLWDKVIRQFHKE